MEQVDAVWVHVHAALETYSNVHRGAGHHSIASTALYERARGVVLEYLGLDEKGHTVVFCTPRGAKILTADLKPGSYQLLSSQDFGLPLGLRALAVKRQALPHGAPLQSGGGTVKIVSPHSVIWADAPDKYEAGTPSVVNAVAFAQALQVIRRCGPGIFQERGHETLAAAQVLYQDELGAYKGPELLRALRKATVGRDVQVPTSEGQRPYVHLDHGASTPTFLPIWQAVCRAWQQPERVQREIVHEVRKICAEFLGAPLQEYEIFFVANTTEAINVVAQNLGRADQDVEPVVLNTLLEHNSNELPWRYVPGVSAVRLPVDDEGFVDVHELAGRLREYNHDRVHGKERIRLVAVSGASNVLGAVNDVPAMSRLAHCYGARILVDAAQLVAHRRVTMEDSGIDYLAFSGHKMYAPFGSGALVVRKGLLRLDEVELEQCRASGEENVVGITALGKAMVLLQRIGMDVIEAEERALTLRALRGLAGVPGIKIFGVQDPRSPRFPSRGGIIAFSLGQVPHNLVAKELAERGGIGVRNGCFCAHLLVKRLLKIHPLRARVADAGLILLPAFTSVVLPGLVRVSLGLDNDESDVDHLIRVMHHIAIERRSHVNRVIAAIHNGTPFVPHTETERRIQEFVMAAVHRVDSLGEIIRA